MAVQTQIQWRRGTASSWTSTNPTLAAGEVGYETDTGKYKVGNGSSVWTSLAYAGGATAVTYLFNATSGQTTFSGADANGLTLAYTVGAEQVYLNGVLQVRGSDYTATNGTSIVLTSGALTSDVLNVIAYSAMSITDTYTQAQANATFIAKSLTTTTGDIIYASGANTPARLGIGSSGQVLSVSGGVPAWSTPASGGMTLLATTTLTGGNVTVSSLTGYKELWFVLRDAYVASNTYIELRFNSDSGSNYTVKWLKGVNTTLSTDGYIAGTTGRVGFIGDSAAAVYRLQGIIRVAAVNQTSGVSYVANVGFNDGTGHTTTVMNGSYNGTAVISSMTLFSGASTFSGGTLLTYGVN